jgi:hypothetical protein
MNTTLEAQRQQALLATLWAQADAGVMPLLHETGERAAMGLQAYEANAGALAERALAAVFPTVQAMIGAPDFKHLAREFWRTHPPHRGDMGEWGNEFPAWLQTHAAFAEWPYLGDCARLDLAIHQCERAADAELNAGSLALLQSADPARLRIVLMPGTATLSSAWPIAIIYSAHAQSHADPSATDLGAVREALVAQRGEPVLVARTGWRAKVHAVDEPTLKWTRLLLDHTPLNLALEQCGEGFDFAAWLARALREGWLKEVVCTGH